MAFTFESCIYIFLLQQILILSGLNCISFMHIFHGKLLWWHIYFPDCKSPPGVNMATGPTEQWIDVSRPATITPISQHRPSMPSIPPDPPPPASHPHPLGGVCLYSKRAIKLLALEQQLWSLLQTLRDCGASRQPQTVPKPPLCLALSGPLPDPFTPPAFSFSSLYCKKKMWWCSSVHISVLSLRPRGEKRKNMDLAR